jgi:hypothetical protein
MPKQTKKARKARTITPTIETEVVAHLPLNVNLAKLSSGNDLRFTVKSGGEMLGRLQLGRGSVRWYVAKAKNPTGDWTWKEFAGLLSRKQ